MRGTLSGPSFARTVGLVILATIVLFVADTFLARVEKAETSAEAARYFREARSLMERGENGRAAERLQDAIAIDRANREYQLTLAEAQLAEGKTADAEVTLNALLQTDSTDGPANLVMARVMVRASRRDEAISYYRRAIYGHWSADAGQNQLRVRFELIDLLAKHGMKEQLLAELLPAEAQAPHDEATELRLGRLFLVAGSPARAADVFRVVLHDSPANADARAGIGEAEFARASYKAAQRDFQTALRFAPDDESIRRRLNVTSDLLALDPTLRGLNPSDRYQRSLKLLQLTLDEARPCAGQSPSTELKGLLDKADAALKVHVRASSQGETAESNLDLTEQLWQARRKECRVPASNDSPLALVLARLSQ